MSATGECRPGAMLPADMLANHLLRLFEEHEAALAARRREVRSAADWERRRAELLRGYRECLGPFPERTSLHARITGVIERPAYRIERLIFESRPGFLVTALAYVPKGRSFPVPGVLCIPGHSENGKAYEVYQRLHAALATKGYFVLTYDPLGQGERKQQWDPVRRASWVGTSTSEHSYLGNQCFLLGINLAQYMIWDSIRALDYLCARPEVDATRIACTGVSGGGTQTAYVTPLDERITVAIPACYITTLAWRRRAWVTGDAEQNFVGQLPAGLDHADLLRLVAPRPLLVNAARFDYFPIEGTRQSYAEARALYELLGVPDRIALAEADVPHGYHLPLRRATYAWLNRWLGEEDEGDEEPEVAVEPEEQLWCTPTGQVAEQVRERVFTLNLELARRTRPARAWPGKAAELPAWQEAVREEASRRIAFRPAGVPVQAAEWLHGYEGLTRLEVVTYRMEEDVVVAGLACLPRQVPPPYRAVLWVDGEGKDTAVARPVVRRLVAQGHLVLAIDVRGTGETAPRGRGSRGATGLMGAESFLTYESFVAGRPLLGMRVWDVICGLEYLAGRPDVAAGPIALAGWGPGALVALHAAVLNQRPAPVLLAGLLGSYRALVEHERYDYPVSACVPGVLAAYEVAELAGALAPRPLLVAAPVDQVQQPLPPKEAAALFTPVRRIYELAGAADCFQLVLDAATVGETLAAWVAGR
jgi:cephalosporin-C deacetylase-like acetyl esterase